MTSSFLSSLEGSSDVVQLQGKVCFGSVLSVAELKNHIKSAETLGLLFWATPVPAMPDTAEEWLIKFRNLLEVPFILI